MDTHGSCDSKYYMYQCDECYRGGGSATCRNGQWIRDGSCDSKYYMYQCDDCYTGGSSATCRNGQWTHEAKN